MDIPDIAGDLSMCVDATFLFPIIDKACISILEQYKWYTEPFNGRWKFIVAKKPSWPFYIPFCMAQTAIEWVIMV